MSACASAWLLDIPKIAFSAAVIVMGWWVVYRLQGLQSRRRLLREQVAQARELVKTIRDGAIDFHTKAYDSETHEGLLELIAELDDCCQLLPQMAQLSTCWLPNAADAQACTSMAQLVMRLRQQVTLAHFDEPEQAALGLFDEQILEIREAAHQAIARLSQIAASALD